MKTMQRSLIIDDERDICQLLSYILSGRNIESEWACSIKDSKRILYKKDFNFVFLDNYLPDGTGIDFVPYLRQSLPDLKIVMITAIPGAITYDSLNRIGIDWLLPKPLHTESVNEVLDHLVRKDAAFVSKSGIMKRFTITFYFNQEEISALVKKSVVGTRTDYTIRPESSRIIQQFGDEITLFKEDENFSVNTSGDGAFDDYVNAITNAIRNQD
jgi:two-component system nitrogen regulation response regulator NtrX